MTYVISLINIKYQISGYQFYWGSFQRQTDVVSWGWCEPPVSQTSQKSEIGSDFMGLTAQKDRLFSEAAVALSVWLAKWLKRVEAATYSCARNIDFMRPQQSFFFFLRAEQVINHGRNN